MSSIDLHQGHNSQSQAFNNCCQIRIRNTWTQRLVLTRASKVLWLSKPEVKWTHLSKMMRKIMTIMMTIPKMMNIIIFFCNADEKRKKRSIESRVAMTKKIVSWRQNMTCPGRSFSLWLTFLDTTSTLWLMELDLQGCCNWCAHFCSWEHFWQKENVAAKYWRRKCVLQTSIFYKQQGLSTNHLRNSMKRKSGFDVLFIPFSATMEQNLIWNFLWMKWTLF